MVLAAENDPMPGQVESQVRIYLLGGFRAERDGEPVPEAAWVRPQVKTLVKFLAVEPSHRLHREEVIERFWPEQATAYTAGNLRRLLSFARRALEPEHRQHGRGDVVIARDEMILLSAAQVWVDADAFAAVAEAAPAGGSVEELEAALALYGGELLPEDRYESWVEERREQLAALHRAVLLALSRGLGGRGDWEPAIRRLRELLSLDPVQEEAHRELMRLFAAAGNRNEALRQHERCCQALTEQLGVQPDEETETLYLAIRNQTGGAAVPLPPVVLNSSLAPLIGRGRALEVTLDNLPFTAGLDGSSPRLSLPGGRGALVFIRGEAGVGKTRLAVEVARIAAGRGATVLWGTSYRQLAYGPFAEALEQWVGGLPRAERTALAEGHPDLARVLPSLVRSTPTPPGDPAGDQLRLFAAIGRFLAEAARRAPLVLVLDDVHRADEASLHLLVYLARLAQRQPWLILCTYREEDVPAGGELEAVMSSLQQSGSRRLALLRLSRRDADLLAEQVLGGPVSDGLREYMFSLALGNPLFTVELLAGLLDSGDLIQTGSGWALSPAGVSSSLLRAGAKVGDLVATRVGALDDPSRRVLALVAANGISIATPTLMQAAALAGLGTEEVLGGIERTLRVHVLVEQEEGYAFAHPLFRETVYAQLTHARRTAVHASLARAIEALQPDDVESLAHHYSQSGEREKRVLYLERAGDRAHSIHANTLAQQRYRDVLRLLSTHGDADHIAHVQLKLGITLNVLGRYDEALSVLEEAVCGLAAAGDFDALGRAVATIGRTHVMRSTAGDAVERLERMISELRGQVDPRVLSDLFDALARCLVALGRYAESESVGERASAHARQRLDTAEGQWYLARSELQRSSAAYFVRPSTEAHEMLLAVMPLIERSGDPELLTHAYNLAAYSALATGELLESCRYYQQALEAAERMADLGRAGRFRCLLGRSWFFVGKGEEGLRIAEEGYAQLAEFGPSLYLAFGSHMLGVIYLGMGRWQEARQRFAEVTAIAGENLEAARLAAYRAAELDLLEDNPEAARNRLEPLFSADASSYDAVLVSAHLAWAYAALGDAGRAVNLAAQAVHRAHATESQLCLVEVLCASGATYLELRQWDAAERALTEGLAITRETRYVWHEAVTQLLLARLRHRQGNPDAACAHRRAGRDLLHALGGEQAALTVDAYAGIAASLASPS